MAKNKQTEKHSNREKGLAGQKRKATSPEANSSKNALENAGSPFRKCQVQLHVTLAPCYTENPRQGVSNYLNGLLMKYVPEAQGVVLAHERIQFLQEVGRIMYDSPFSHFDVRVEMLVWKPVVGSLLVGAVSLQSSDHIGLLIHRTFNASVSAARVPSHFEWRDHQWWDKSKGAPLSGEVTIRVVDLVMANDMLTVVASLQNVEGGRMDMLEMDNEEEKERRKKLRKVQKEKRRKEVKEEDEKNGGVTEVKKEEVPKEEGRKSKDKKKKRSRE
ncbi:MAG: hypothetical protein DHS80DRAFT_28874 [Piptocephalis tieghemiana]|nr:MAG: hypothetical protein DHS80DRAFT_28874 [Piptocephalis tieghemiana]